MREHPADPRAEVIGDENPPAQPELPMSVAPAAEAPTKP
jgi:sec-independent protein translocase protein TatB